jgi:glycosyltransferase involved in cell wall biosynthesis
MTAAQATIDPDCMKGLHVVIVPSWWPSPEQPIAGIFHVDYARAFAAAGAKVGVVVPDLVSARLIRRRSLPRLWPRIQWESVAPDVPVVRIRGVHTSLGRPRAHMRRFRRWLHRGLAAYAERFGRPDVIHAMCAIPAGWACTCLDDALSARTIVTENTGPFELAMTPPPAGAMVLEALSRAAGVTAVSQRLRRAMTAAGVKRDIDVIPNPVGEPFRFAPPPGDARGEDGRRLYSALFIGRLTAEKGLRELLNAAERLSRDPEFDLRWHIAGDGPLMADVRRAAAGESLRARLVLHGLCEREIVARLIGADDGVLCDAADAESLAEAVRCAIANYGRWDHASIAGRAQKRFGGGAIADAYSRVYKKTIERD